MATIAKVVFDHDVINPQPRTIGGNRIPNFDTTADLTVDLTGDVVTLTSTVAGIANGGLSTPIKVPREKVLYWIP